MEFLTEIHLILIKVYINQVVRILFAPEFFLIFDILMFSFSIKNIALINIYMLLCNYYLDLV